MHLKVPWLLQHDHNSLNTDIPCLFKHDLHCHMYTKAKCKCKLKRIIKKFIPSFFPQITRLQLMQQLQVSHFKSLQKMNANCSQKNRQKIYLFHLNILTLHCYRKYFPVGIYHEKSLN